VPSPAGLRHVEELLRHQETASMLHLKLARLPPCLCG
jgi:hypothetical protein